MMLPVIRDMRLRRWRLLAVAALTAVTTCKTDCVAGTGCGGPVTYGVTLELAPANLGATLLSIETDAEATVSVLSGRALPAQVDGTGIRRAILIGASPLVTAVTIRFNSIPANPPRIGVLEAAANQSGGYSPIPASEVRFRVEQSR